METQMISKPLSCHLFSNFFWIAPQLQSISLSSHLPHSPYEHRMSGIMKITSCLWWPVIGHNKMELSCIRGCSHWTSGKGFSLKGWTGFPGKGQGTKPIWVQGASRWCSVWSWEKQEVRLDDSYRSLPIWDILWLYNSNGLDYGMKVPQQVHWWLMGGVHTLGDATVLQRGSNWLEKWISRKINRQCKIL